MREQSHVFELREFGDSHSNCYFALASGLNFEILLSAKNPEEGAGSADIQVDLKELRRNLQMILMGGGRDRTASGQ